GGGGWVGGGGAPERLAADHHGPSVWPVIEAHRPVIERDAQLRIAGRLEEILAHAQRGVDDRVGIVVRDRDRVAFADLVPQAVRGVLRYRLAQRLADGLAGVWRVHEAAELLDVGLEHGQRALPAV